ncbi:FtsW/RodA/SpoVE family cell cycle protein [Kamptonema cortianum]|nr:FtsW/RodA/SpoVE family cell cycle protein [Geitlerinema splendidum]MDK3160361.1 FtsW/RodA/SpoVE family cell cycle protein [Kamptonema cortianum]
MNPIASSRAIGAQAHKESRPRDVWLLLAAMLLAATGLTAIYSVSPYHASRQAIFAAVGIGVFFLFNRVRLEMWKKLSPILYGVTVLLLLAVLVMGEGRGEATRWIGFGAFQFQPSEFAKVTLSITLASYFSNRADRIREIWVLLGALLHVAPILALVFVQPHLGATLALIFMSVVAAIHAGTRWRHLALLLPAFILLATVAWVTPGLLPEYQRQRVYAMYDRIVYKKIDKKDSDYQVHQSVLAIASGGATGVGFFQGNQKEARAIPDQRTDFIFSVIGEEGGLVGSTIVLGLFALFFYRIWIRIYESTSLMSRVLGASLFAILGFHMMVNLAMVLQIGPVVGLWLPFISYGGTALWMCMAAVGLIEQLE